MFRFLLPFSLLLFVLALLNCQQPPSSTSLKEVLKHEIDAVKKELPSYRLTVGAHRGSSVSYRENTLPALRAAEEDASYAFVEFDVQYTRDKQIVLYHDRWLFRLFGKSDALGRTSYADLLQLTDGEIILYQEAMGVIGKKINLEIKSQGNQQDDQRLADAVIADLKKRGREKDVMVSSISSELVRYHRASQLSPFHEIPHCGKQNNSNGYIDNVRSFNRIEQVIDSADNPEPPREVLVNNGYSTIYCFCGSPAAFHGTFDTPDMSLCLCMRTGQEEILNRSFLRRHVRLGVGGVDPFGLKMLYSFMPENSHSCQTSTSRIGKSFSDFPSLAC
jgi:glycerophosphoryl diester phosphodiesterase